VDEARNTFVFPLATRGRVESLTLTMRASRLAKE
jgi:hypothetical protein